MSRLNTGRIDPVRTGCTCGAPPTRHAVWKVRVTVPRTTTRLSRNVHGTRADARRMLEHLLAERTVLADQPAKAGGDVGPDPTVAEVAAGWWPTHAAGLSPNTVSSWQSALDNHVLPAVGHRPVRTLRRTHIKRMVEVLRAKPLGRDRTKTCVTVLSGILAAAVELELRDDNPAYGFPVTGGEPPAVVAATVEEVHALVNAALRTQPDVAAAIVLAVDTGLRRNEVCALRWRDVDLDAGVIVVRHAVAKGAKGQYGHAKGAVLRRTKTGVVVALSLSEGSVAALRGQHERQTRAVAGLSVNMADTYVFGIVPDRPMYPDTLSSRFARVRSAAAEEAGITLDHVSFRSLRHSCATLLLTDGTDLRTVSGRLRHGRTSTTSDRYADWVPAADARAAAAMDRLFGFAGSVA